MVCRRHECRECGEAVLHTGVEIERHLAGEHGLGLGEYWARYWYSHTASTALVYRHGHSIQPARAGRPSDWADRCVYQCGVCSPASVFDTHSKMSYHVKKKHNMAMKDYTAQHGRAMVHEEKHTCQVQLRWVRTVFLYSAQICGSSVLWERSSIYQHIYQVQW